MPRFRDPKTHKFISEAEAKKRGIKPEGGLKFHESFEKFAKEEAKELGISEEEYVKNLFSREFMIVEFDEATGEASLKLHAGSIAEAVDKMTPEKLLEEYKDLRENFAPVSAGIEYHKIFICYSDDTEILTENGWKLFKDLGKDEKVATLNPETNNLEYHYPYRFIDYNYSGEMYHFESQQVDLLVTPEHSMYVKPFLRIDYPNSFKLMEAKKAQKYAMLEFKKDAKWNCVDKDVFYLPLTKKVTSDKIFSSFDMKDWLEFFGYYIAEGCVNRKPNGYYIKISQSKEKHPETYRKIEECLKRLGYTYHKNDKFFGIWNKQLYLYLKQFGHAWEKYIPKEIKKLPPKKLKILYDALIDGDGTIYKYTKVYSTSSKRLIDDIQEILLKLGYCGNIHPIQIGKQGNKRLMYRICEIDKHGLTPIIQRRKEHIRKEKYSGKIYDITVPNHIIYVRRNGKPIWSGNCGSGFDVITDDPKDKHKIEMRDLIKKFCKDVYMDFYYKKGLDKLMFSLVDDALTYGATAAKIVYEIPIPFEKFAEKTNVKTKVGDRAILKWKTREPTIGEWKKFKGVKRLVIIDNAISRLIPYIEDFEVKYWIIDEIAKKSQTQEIKEKVGTAPTKEGVKCHPFEIFWLAWNARGTNLKGESIIRPALEIARLVRKIQRAIGKGFERWADKKYFFICGTEKRTWNKNAQRRFLKYLELMVKKKWTGVPVPYGFDVKEIGGDVFEGTNILNHLINMICAAMNYPRDFLEQGRTRAGDKAWLAWQVKYGSNQRQLRRDIEQQLFQKHIWCKKGQFYRVPKQNVEARKREKREVYVPKIIWKAEGRWQMAEEIKTLQGWLNVANPIGPEFKLAIEKRGAEIMGFGNIPFPSFAELRREMKRMAKAEEMKLKKMMERGEKDEDDAKTKLEKRKDSGVSKMVKETGKPSEKGVARPQGKTRQPKVKKEGMPPKS